MADRYWVGGAGTWNTTSTTNWSDTSGGIGGASVPTSADDVYFDVNSGIPLTVTIGSAVSCGSFNMLAGSISFSGSLTITFYGDFFINNGGAAFTSYTGIWTGAAQSGTRTIATNGSTIGRMSLAAASTAGYVLGSAINNSYASSDAFRLASGNFDTAGYTMSGGGVTFAVGATNSLYLRNSSISGTYGVTQTVNATGFVDPGTSNVTCGTSNNSTFGGTNSRWYNVTVRVQDTGSTWSGPITILSNLVLNKVSTAGTSVFPLTGNLTVDGTLSMINAASATMRVAFTSSASPTRRTISVGAFSGSLMMGFADIQAAGTATWNSTSFSDYGNNAGITFRTGVTVYVASTGTMVSSAMWALTPGGAGSVANFPLGQDTIKVVDSGLPSGGIITNSTSFAQILIPNFDCSERTLPFTINNGTNFSYTHFCGDVILSNSVSYTATGTGTWTYSTYTTTARRPSGVRVGSGGVTWPLASIWSLATGQSATLANNLTLAGTFSLPAGSTLNLAGFVLSSATFTTGTTGSINFGGGAVTCSGNWTTGGSAVTVTGSGSINMTSAGTKTFAGAGVKTYPTLVQAGTGTLTVTGSNKFADINNTAIGSVLFAGGTTNEFDAFNLDGVSTAQRLTLGSTTTTKATLKKPSPWIMGAGSIDNGNNIGLTFTSGGTIDFLAVSYIIGVEVVVAPPGTGNSGFFAFF